MTYAPLPTSRQVLIEQLSQPVNYDLAVVGGGATGLGVALDAAARGYRVVLLEALDFAKGTSSRSTKLVHGGVRYLAQGNLGLVREALHERALLLANAPHLAQPLSFVMPAYRWWEKPFYGLGLKAYDALAGSAGLGSTELLGAQQTMAALPNIQTTALLGGVKYWDGQFDDARLALALARTAAREGALLLNYCRVTELKYDHGRIAGLMCTDTETGRSYAVRANCVINATGVWVDALREQDGPASQAQGGHPVRTMVAPSQGVHLVVDQDFLPGSSALMVPKTRDGRVLFAVPWLGKLILGTTDSPSPDLSVEPKAFSHEVDFILNEASNYLSRAPGLQDVKSIWVGLRPLVKPLQDEAKSTKGLSREHTVLVSRTGLVTVTGGKWTTYRAMAQDVLEKCFDKSLLKRTQAGVTTHLKLIGSGTSEATTPLIQKPGWHNYGSESAYIYHLPGSSKELMDGLTESMVVFAARFEYARTVEDVLARRSRLLFLDAKKAAQLAFQTAKILRGETGADPQTEAFLHVCGQYTLRSEK